MCTLKLFILPEGTFNDDQMSKLTLDAFKGGQFITGKLVQPAITGPRPLLRPATATITTGTFKPKKVHKLIRNIVINK